MNFTWTNGRSLETATKGDLTTSYKYNQDNLRTSKTVNGVTTTYIWEDSTLIAEETSGIVTWYIYDANGSVIGFQRQESADSKTFTTYYYEKNLQGDIVAIYGEDGTELAGYTYNTWGEITGITGDENLAKSNPWRYRGYYYDEEIGMYYLQSRYYDAEAGRFLNADDAEMLLLAAYGLKGANTFEYGDNDPINKIDKNSLWATYRKNTSYKSKTQKKSFGKGSYFKYSLGMSLTRYLRNSSVVGIMVIFSMTCTLFISSVDWSYYVSIASIISACITGFICTYYTLNAYLATAIAGLVGLIVERLGYKWSNKNGEFYKNKQIYLPIRLGWTW